MKIQDKYKHGNKINRCESIRKKKDNIHIQHRKETKIEKREYSCHIVGRGKFILKDEGGGIWFLDLYSICIGTVYSFVILFA